jgi:hypothetical protein
MVNKLVCGIIVYTSDTPGDGSCFGQHAVRLDKKGGGTGRRGATAINQESQTPGSIAIWVNHSNIGENVRVTALKGAEVFLAPHQTGGCDSSFKRKSSDYRKTESKVLWRWEHP